MLNSQLYNVIQQRLSKVLEDQANNSPNYSSKLKEKGVEYALILPILDNLLGFDPLEDIEYETSSTTMNNQRFDFLLDKCFVVECKSLENPLNNDNISQVYNYISKNKNINYGILTNGLRFEFFMQKNYIENIANNGDEIINFEKDVYNILKTKADDDDFYDVIQLFSKQNYSATFEAIAKYVFKQLELTKGKDPVIVANKELNDNLKYKISKKLNINHGFYFKDIKKGNIEPGTELGYSDEYIGFKVIVQSDGTLLMPKGTMRIDANKIIEDGVFYPVFENFKKWYYNEDRIFKGPKTIFREASGKSKIHNKNWKLTPS